MALSIQAGTGSERLCCAVGSCERGAEEEEEEEDGKEGLGMDAQLGARDVLVEVGTFKVGGLTVGKFTCNVAEGAGCREVVSAGRAVSFSTSISSL